MTTAKRRVLVAIKDVAYPPRLELRKAAELARAVNARIELFHVVAPARGGDAEPLARARARLEQFSKQAVFQGLTVSTHVDAGNPPHEAIVRRAISTRAHFVVLAMRARGWFSRLLLSNTDWEVIRQCPCPVLLIRSRREYAGSPVIAAIDPFHTHAKPADLDRELLELSRTLAKKFHGTVHIAHVYTGEQCAVSRDDGRTGVSPAASHRGAGGCDREGRCAGGRVRRRTPGGATSASGLDSC